MKCMNTCVEWCLVGVDGWPCRAWQGCAPAPLGHLLVLAPSAHCMLTAQQSESQDLAEQLLPVSIFCRWWNWR